MTQKPSSDKSASTLVQSIDPSTIADESLRKTLEILLNIIEQQQAEIKALREDKQKLEDEVNRLKGEQGKPDIKAKNKKGFSSNHSSEKERSTPKKHLKSGKNERIILDRTEIRAYPPEKLPPDAQFKGYDDVVVQEINLKTNNVLFRKEKYYSPSLGKTYLAELPTGYDGTLTEIKALVISLYYGSNVTQSKILDFLGDIGISMSAGYLSNLLIRSDKSFEIEKNEVYVSGLASSPWQHLDQTGARVAGVNHTTNVICNPLYTAYFTTVNKDRLSVLKVLQNTTRLKFLLSPLTYELLTQFQIPEKWKNCLKGLPQLTVLSEEEFNTLLDLHLPKIGSINRTRVSEAAAITFYQQQTSIPVVQTLICDDAPQFKLLTSDLALCWIHEARHYKKLSPFIPYHQGILDKFLEDFWNYYRDLLAYKDCPSQQLTEKLRSEFLKLFSTPSGYEVLDERKRLTAAKMPELLKVLEHPELPLHNNPAELAARTMVQRRNISYATQTEDGTSSWDIFMSPFGFATLAGRKPTPPSGLTCCHYS